MAYVRQYESEHETSNATRMKFDETKPTFANDILAHLRDTAQIRDCAFVYNEALLEKMSTEPTVPITLPYTGTKEQIRAAKMSNLRSTELYKLDLASYHKRKEEIRSGYQKMCTEFSNCLVKKKAAHTKLVIHNKMFSATDYEEMWKSYMTNLESFKRDSPKDVLQIKERIQKATDRDGFHAMAAIYDNGIAELREIDKYEDGVCVGTEEPSASELKSWVQQSFKNDKAYGVLLRLKNEPDFSYEDAMQEMEEIYRIHPEWDSDFIAENKAAVKAMRIGMSSPDYDSNNNNSNANMPPKKCFFCNSASHVKRDCKVTTCYKCGAHITDPVKRWGHRCGPKFSKNNQGSSHPSKKSHNNTNNNNKTDNNNKNDNGKRRVYYESDESNKKQKVDRDNVKHNIKALVAMVKQSKSGKAVNHKIKDIMKSIEGSN